MNALKRLPFAAVALAVAACGGGGSGSGPQTAVRVEPPPPSKPVVQPQGNSNTRFGTTKRDYYPLNARFQKIRKPTRQEYNREFYEAALVEYEAGTCCWEMAEGSSDIASREEVLSMLRENIYSFENLVRKDADPDTPPGIVASIKGHSSPPEVRIVSGSGPKAALTRAVDNINAWLPYRLHITVGNDISASADPGTNVIRANLNQVRDDEFDGDGGFYEINITEKHNENVSLIQHELLHALGMSGGRSCYETFGADCDTASLSGPQNAYSHVPISEFPESTMSYVSPYDDEHGLSQIDGETIQTIYTRLHTKRETYLERPGAFYIEDETISAEDLGPWDDSVIRYSGSFDRPIDTDFHARGHSVHGGGRVFWHSSGSDPLSMSAAFGVDWRNGIARPWTVGQPPEATFADSGLVGNAAWRGELVGFTPIREAVYGNSAISVNLATMAGSAAFTALEHWNAGAAPGEPGTGMQWNDGDLHYSIGLGGNYLRSNGGDEGYVSGRFVGGRHEGAVGILERPDLTAAFGASRKE